MATSTKKSDRMSDEAVQVKTGKSWEEWFKILDKAGAKKMNHKEIVAHLNQKHMVCRKKKSPFAKPAGEIHAAHKVLFVGRQHVFERGNV